jgi:hypothetical protein
LRLRVPEDLVGSGEVGFSDSLNFDKSFGDVILKRSVFADGGVAEVGWGCRVFVATASMTPFNQVLIIDGPAVLGWQLFRQIDDAYFATPTSRTLRAARPDLPRKQIDALAGTIIASMCGSRLTGQFGLLRGMMTTFHDRESSCSNSVEGD